LPDSPNRAHDTRDEIGFRLPTPPWLSNRRIFWWALLIGASCSQVLLAIRGGWTVRHSLSLPVFVTAVLVVHPVMNQKLPLLRADLLKSWRVYAFVSLVAIVSLIDGTLIR
jgi:hypothetical protein